MSVEDASLDRRKTVRQSAARNTARKLSAEAAGTFILVMVGTGAIVLDANMGGTLGDAGIGAAFGLAVFSAIYLLGRISGAHVNPAVTLGLAVTGHFPLSLVPWYWGAQLAGAAAASAVVAALSGGAATLGGTLPSGAPLESLLVEMGISFVLMLVIATVAVGFRTPHLAVAFSVGATVGLFATLAGPISGASMNPARSFGPALVGGGFEHHWLYWAGPLTGCVLAALLFLVLKRSIRARNV